MNRIYRTFENIARIRPFGGALTANAFKGAPGRKKKDAPTKVGTPTKRTMLTEI